MCEKSTSAAFQRPDTTASFWEVVVAKIGTLTHLKTRRLAEKLDIDLSRALGLFESLLQVAMEQNPPDGGVGKLTNKDLVYQMRTSLDPNKVINAMLSAGQLERNKSAASTSTTTTSTALTHR